MTVRISAEEVAVETVIRVAGWLEGEDEAAELVRVAERATMPVVLDLEELQSADQNGIAALRTLAAQGVRFVRVSGYIKLLLGTIDETSEIASTGIGGSA
jgi:hypothetical protein